MRRHGSFAQCIGDPGPRGVGVGHRLLRGEGLGGHQYQCLGWIEPACGHGQAGGIDVGDKACVQNRAAREGQRFGGHQRAEIGAANADIDHMSEPRTTDAADLTVMHLPHKSLHTQQFGRGKLRGVFPPARQIGPETALCAIAQRHVHCRPAFSGVDGMAFKKSVAKEIQRRRTGMAEQGGKRLVIDGCF